MHELGGVGDEVLKLAVDGVDSEHGVFADVRVPVLQAGAAGGDEGFEEFGVLGDFLEEAEGCAADVFVGVLLGVAR